MWSQIDVLMGGGLVIAGAAGHMFASVAMGQNPWLALIRLVAAFPMVVGMMALAASL